MVSEKQFQAWLKIGTVIGENAQASVRASVEAEVDVALAEIARENERRAGAEQFRRAARHRDQITGRGAATVTPAQEAERRAEIRRQVEREMDAYMLSRRG